MKTILPLSTQFLHNFYLLSSLVIWGKNSEPCMLQTLVYCPFVRAVPTVFPHVWAVVYDPAQSPPSYSGDILYIPKQATVPGLFLFHSCCRHDCTCAVYLCVWVTVWAAVAWQKYFELATGKDWCCKSRNSLLRHKPENTMFRSRVALFCALDHY